jgi:hypothetical protein
MDTARRLKRNTASQAVLITILEHYNTVAPPKMALSARLVSAEDPLQILWATGVGLAGNEAPGLLELDLIEDPQILLNQALDRLTASLVSYLSGAVDPVADLESNEKFRPDMSFLPFTLSPNRNYTVAVVPFFNHSYRKHAGELLSLHFVRSLRNVANFILIEPGEVRQALLQSRVVMHDGISLSDAGALFNRLDVDLVLTGQVFDYEDYQGSGGVPRVGFSAEIIERHTREVVWLTRSHHVGDEGVYFFDWGKIHTAHVLAARMVNQAVDTLRQ